MRTPVNNSILIVGSLAFDTVQTPMGRQENILGGSGNYFSVAASLYAPVKIVGVVGDDFPESHLEWLSKRNIDTSGIQIIKGGKTFHWAGAYGENLNEAQTLTTSLNVFENFQPVLNDLQIESSYLFLANIDPSIQLQVVKQLKNSQLIICDSMNFWIHHKKQELLQMLKEVDILSINESEAYLLSGIKNILQAAENILKMGPSALIIKRGEYGAMLFTKDELFIAPAFPTFPVVDPTGAGDSFAGAFVGYLAKAQVSRSLAQKNPQEWNNMLRRAVLSGCVMASFTVEDFSFNRLKKLDISDLDKRHLQLMKMIQIN